MLRKLAINASSFIKEVHYDVTSQTMRIDYSTGKSFQATGVDASIATALESADSPGAFFHAQLKKAFTWSEV